MSTKLNKSIAMLLSVVMVLTMLPFAVMTASATETTSDGFGTGSAITKGSGTASDPYIIENVEGLNELAQRVNGEYTPSGATEPEGERDFNGKYFKLQNDIDASTGFTTPIGKNKGNNVLYPSNSYFFYGTFDGNGKTVKLSINQTVSSGDAYVGLFGCNDGTIKNLTVDGMVSGSCSSGDVYAGGVCGYNNGTIANCTNKATVVATYNGSETKNSYAGGICGSNEYTNATILNCSNQGQISAVANTNGKAVAGGICGYGKGNIINSYNVKDIIKDINAIISSSNINYAEAGGICGYFGGTRIINCYSSGNITATNNEGSSSKTYKGGIVGELYRSQDSDQRTFGCYYKKESGESASIYGVGVTNSTIGDPTSESEISDVSGTSPLTITEMKGGTLKTNLDNYIDTNKLYEAKKWVDVASDYPTFETINVALSGGTGTESNPYLVKTVDDLNILAHAVNTMAEDYAGKYIKLENDITEEFKEEKGFIGGGGQYIGGEENAFAGTFDGDGKSIELKIDNPTTEPTTEVALFGMSCGTIKNLTTKGSINAKCYEGNSASGICYGNIGTIENCCNECEITTTTTATDDTNYETSASGVCAENRGSIVNCSNAGVITSTSKNLDGVYASGVCCMNDGGTIANCSNSGDIKADSTTEAYASGVCAYNEGGAIVNCYNTGDVKATVQSSESSSGGEEAKASGICAINESSVANCYNVGSISAENAVEGGKTYIGAICAVQFVVSEESEESEEDNNEECVTEYQEYEDASADDEDYEEENEEYYDDMGLNEVIHLPLSPNRKNYVEMEQAITKNCYYLDTSVPKGCYGIGATDNDERTILCDKDIEGETEVLSVESMKGSYLKGMLNDYVDTEKTVKYMDENEETHEITLENWYTCSENNGFPVFGYVYNKFTEATVTAVDLAITSPQAGQKLADKVTANVKSTPANTVTATVEEIDWFDDTESYVKKAECGGEYTVDVTLSAKVADGYKLAVDPALKVTVNGKDAKVTLNSDNTITVSYAFDKVQHTWDDGKVVKNATKKHGAVRLFTCTVCGEGVKTEYLPQSTQTIKLLKKKYKAKNKTVKIKAQAKGSKLRFRALNKSKYYRVNKYGRIRFRNGAKGTYKIKVRIRALVNNSYKQAKITKVIKVKVK